MGYSAGLNFVRIWAQLSAECLTSDNAFRIPDLGFTVGSLAYNDCQKKILGSFEIEWLVWESSGYFALRKANKVKKK